MGNQKVWFALVGVKPLKGNELIDPSLGAYVNVACLSNSKKSFMETLKANFEYHKFSIFEIEDISTQDSLSDNLDESLEWRSLLSEIKEGYEFAWGPFHTFDAD